MTAVDADTRSSAEESWSESSRSPSSVVPSMCTAVTAQASSDGPHARSQPAESAPELAAAALRAASKSDRESERLKKQAEKQVEKQAEKERKDIDRAERERVKLAERVQKEQLRLQREAEREEAKRARDEAERVKLAERQLKEQVRAQREAEKEEARLLKEEKEAERVRLREEKERAKAAAKEAREAERKRIEDARLAKEQSQKRLNTFFMPVAKKIRQEGPLAECVSDFSAVFRPFYLKPTATLGPAPGEDDDVAMDVHGIISSWVMEASSRRFPIVHFAATEGLSQSRVIKLLCFHEDHRPAFYGTQNVASMDFVPSLSPRRPFKQDRGALDYEYDSEAEWVCDEDGEDLRSEDEEDDDEPVARAGSGGKVVTGAVNGADWGSDEEDDEDWVVRDGHLSSDEGVNDAASSDSQSETDGESDEEKAHAMIDNDGMAHGAKKTAQVKSDKNKKRIPLKSLTINMHGVNLFGLGTTDGSMAKSTLLDTQHTNWLLFEAIRCPVWNCGPIDPFEIVKNPVALATTAKKASILADASGLDMSKRVGARVKDVPDEAIPFIIQAVHGSIKGIAKLASELHEKFPESSKRQMEVKIKELARKDGSKWLVKDEFQALAPVLVPS